MDVELVSGSPVTLSPQPRCVRSGCENPPVISKDWDNEYCSNECVVKHCRDVFLAWVASRNPNSVVFVKQPSSSPSLEDSSAGHESQSLLLTHKLGFWQCLTFTNSPSCLHLPFLSSAEARLCRRASKFTVIQNCFLLNCKQNYQLITSTGKGDGSRSQGLLEEMSVKLSEDLTKCYWESAQLCSRRKQH